MGQLPLLQPTDMKSAAFVVSWLKSGRNPGLVMVLTTHLQETANQPTPCASPAQQEDGTGGGSCHDSLTFLAVSPREAPLAHTLVALHPGAAGASVLAWVGLLGAGVGTEWGDFNGAADVLLLQQGNPFDGDLEGGEGQESTFVSRNYEP